MTISFNTIPSNTLVPLFYAEMDNQAANTAQDSGASLLIGHANNGAEIVANSLVLMPSADYARQICGAGSQLARMVEAYRQTDPFGELYVIAVPEATGAAATVTLTVTGAATESGTVNVYVGRTRDDCRQYPGCHQCRSGPAVYGLIFGWRGHTDRAS